MENRMHSLIEKLLPKRILGYLHPKDGITMSDANHIANMTKQIAEISSTKAHNIVSSQDTMTIDGTAYVLKEYSKPTEDDFILPGELFGLSAWLRQAVKAKEEGIELLRVAALTDIKENQPVLTHKRPDKSEFHFPAIPKEVEIDKPFGEILDIAEYAEYLALEAKAAYIGKLIHQGQPLDKVRNEILNWQPISFMKFDGAERIIVRNKLFDEGEINKLYLKLQTQHREVESKLNWYKAKIKNDAVVISAQKAQDYTEAYNKTQALYTEAMRLYNDAEREYEKQFVLWSTEAQQTRKELQKLFSSYRIIIPNQFSKIYEFISDTLTQKS